MRTKVDLIKRYHALCFQLGMTDDERMAVISHYGVESSKDMKPFELEALCQRLFKEVDKRKKGDEMDKLRKRAMAAIGGYMKATGRYCNANIIKGIACRVTKYDAFNKIPKERLRNLYYTFNHFVKDKQNAEKLKGVLGVMGVKEKDYAN